MVTGGRLVQRNNSKNEVRKHGAFDLQNIQQENLQNVQNYENYDDDGSEDETPVEKTSRMIATQKFYTSFFSFTSLVFKLGVILQSSLLNSLINDKNVKLPSNTNTFISVFYFGCIFGVLGAALFNSYKSSRKNLLITAGSISFVSWYMMMNGMKTYNQFLFFRFFDGVGVGLYSVSIYYYVYECIYVNQISFRDSSLQYSKADFLLMIGLTFLSEMVDNKNMVLFLYSSLHLATVLLVIIYAPESPYIFARNKDLESAEDSFEKLVDVDTTFTRKLFTSIKDDANNSINFKVSKDYYMICIKTAFVFVFHELSGITIYCCYFPKIVKDRIVILLASIVIVKYLASFFSIPIQSFQGIEDLKKRLKLSSFSMRICSFLLGIAFYLNYLTGYYFPLILLLICYFYSYMTGWISGHHLFFENKMAYCMKVKLIIPALLGKFITIFILTSYIDSSITGLGWWSIIFCVFQSSLIF